MFYGAGEVAETILSVYQKRRKETPKVLAIIDDQEKTKEEIYGCKVIGRDEINNYTFDGIVITSYTFEDEIKERLEEIDYPKERIELFFSEM